MLWTTLLYAALLVDDIVVGCIGVCYTAAGCIDVGNIDVGSIAVGYTAECYKAVGYATVGETAAGYSVALLWLTLLQDMMYKSRRLH